MVLSLVMPASALDGQVQAERREGYDAAAIHYTDGEGNERPLPRQLPATPIPLSLIHIFHTDLAHHLADNDLDVLIVDVHALLTVHLQDLLNEVVMHRRSATDPQHIVRCV